MALRLKALAGRNSDDESIVEIARSVQHNVDTFTAHAIPWLEWNRVKILGEKTANDVDPLRADPTIIRRVHYLDLALDFFVGWTGHIFYHQNPPRKCCYFFTPESLKPSSTSGRPSNKTLRGDSSVVRIDILSAPRVMLSASEASRL